jgi:hypothetical protein
MTYALNMYNFGYARYCIVKHRGQILRSQINPTRRPVMMKHADNGASPITALGSDLTMDSFTGRTANRQTRKMSTSDPPRWTRSETRAARSGASVGWSRDAFSISTGEVGLHGCPTSWTKRREIQTFSRQNPGVLDYNPRFHGAIDARFKIVLSTAVLDNSIDSVRPGARLTKVHAKWDPLHQTSMNSKRVFAARYSTVPN